MSGVPAHKKRATGAIAPVPAAIDTDDVSDDDTIESTESMDSIAPISTGLVKPKRKRRADAAPAPINILDEGVVFGDEDGDTTVEEIVDTVHVSSRPLAAFDNFYAVGTEHSFRYWADVPTEFLAEKITVFPSGFRSQISRDGTLVRWRHDGLKMWRTPSTGSEPGLGSSTKITQRHFKILSTQFQANRLVAAAFFGLPPMGRPNACHAKRRSIGSRSDDAAWNISWCSQQENLDDQTTDLTAGNKKGHSSVIWGRPIDAAEDAVQATLPDGTLVQLTEKDATNHAYNLRWASFTSLSDAARKIGKYPGGISAVLSGHSKQSAGWRFRWPYGEKPAVMCLLDWSARGRRFMTPDGRLIREKIDYSEPGSDRLCYDEQIVPKGLHDDYCRIKVNNHGHIEIQGTQLVHRVVMWLFGQDKISAATEKTGLTFAQLVVDHDNDNKLDNRIENLLFDTGKANTQRAISKAVVERESSDPMSAIVRNTDGSEHRWPSQVDAAMSTGICRSRICNNCTGKMDGIVDTSTGRRRYFFFAS